MKASRILLLSCIIIFLNTFIHPNEPLPEDLGLFDFDLETELRALPAVDDRGVREAMDDIVVPNLCDTLSKACIIESLAENASPLSQLDSLNSKMSLIDSNLSIHDKLIFSKLGILDTVTTSTLCEPIAQSVAATISTSGSYCLTTNITGNFIITGSNITLDLNERVVTGIIQVSGDNVVIRNGTIAPSAPANNTTANNGAILLQAGATRIYLENLRIDCPSSTGSIDGFTGIRCDATTNATPILIKNCFIQAGNGLTTGSVGVGGHGINITSAGPRVVIHQSTIFGGNGSTTKVGGSGAITNAQIIIEESTLSGGSSASNASSATNGGDGGIGLDMSLSSTNSFIYESIIYGGNGGISTGDAPASGGMGGIAVKTAAPNTTIMQCAITAGNGGNGSTDGNGGTGIACNGEQCWIQETIINGGRGGTAGRAVGGAGGDAVSVTKQQCSITQSTLTGGSGTLGGFGNGGAGGCGLVINGDEMEVIECIITGSTGGNSAASGSGGTGGTGLVATGIKCYIIDSIITGSNGGNSLLNGGTGGAGGNGMTLTGTWIRVIESQITAGSGGGGGTGGTGGAGGNGGDGISVSAQHIDIVESIIFAGGGGGGGGSNSGTGGAGGAGGNGITITGPTCRIKHCEITAGGGGGSGRGSSAGTAGIGGSGISAAQTSENSILDCKITAYAAAGAGGTAGSLTAGSPGSLTSGGNGGGKASGGSSVSGTPGNYGIRLASATQCVLARNALLKSYRHGIFLDTAASINELFDNNIGNVQTSSDSAIKEITSSNTIAKNLAHDIAGATIYSLVSTSPHIGNIKSIGSAIALLDNLQNK